MKKTIIIAVGVCIALAVLFYFYKDSSVTVENNTTASSTNTQTTQTTKTSTGSVSGTKPATQYTVKYTDKGFVPKNLQVPKGTKVTFINTSSKSMRIFSDDLTDSRFTEINQPKSIGRNGVYTFNFGYTGVWAYHNQLNPEDTGSVVVY
jgi:plastocyanin